MPLQQGPGGVQPQQGAGTTACEMPSGSVLPPQEHLAAPAGQHFGRVPPPQVPPGPALVPPNHEGVATAPGGLAYFVGAQPHATTRASKATILCWLCSCSVWSGSSKAANCAIGRTFCWERPWQRNEAFFTFQRLWTSTRSLCAWISRLLDIGVGQKNLNQFLGICIHFVYGQLVHFFL